jgi:restriction system protein
MGVPALREMVEPLLRVLAESPEGIPAKRAQDLVADRLALSAEDRSQRVAKGSQHLFRHRANWAHDRLKRAGLSSAPRKGVWRATKEGLELARSQDVAPEQIVRTARSLKLPGSSTEEPGEVSTAV